MIISLVPITTRSAFSVNFGSAKAFKITSGPIPAGSPSVNANLGRLFSLVLLGIWLWVLGNNSTSSTVSCSVVSCQWSVVSGQLSVVSGQWSVVSCQWSVVSGQWSVVGCHSKKSSFLISLFPVALSP
ncbi:MAG: hypothetical protein ACKPGJ_03280, partial [Dolichospermum sp.]